MNLGNLESVVVLLTETNDKEYHLCYNDKTDEIVKPKDLTSNELFIIELVNSISTLRTIKEVAIAETSLSNNAVYKIETSGDITKDFNIHITRDIL